MTAAVGLVGNDVKSLSELMAFPAELRRFELPLGRYADLNPRGGDVRVFSARKWSLRQRDRRIDHIRLAPIELKALGRSQLRIGCATRARWPDTPSI